MRSSKDRTIQKKRVNKANKIAKTERSRKRRLINKAKREEIHDIDPDVEIKIIDQDTYIDGDKVEIVNGKIVPSALPEDAIKTECDYEDKVEEIIDIGDDLSDFDDAVEEYKVVIEEPVVEKIKLKNKSALQRLTDRFKKG